jgi:multidrug efflux pump subunit AcrA (membrane-fusion protein)
LTGFRRADRQANGLRDFEKRELVRTAGYALRQMQQIDRMHQSLWARVWGHHQTGTPTVFSRLKRLIVMAVIVAVITLVLIMPVPNTIEATATLRAQNTQRICALGDAVVETIFVEHGQHVRSGQILMTLSDANLEQQMTTLVGRRAVLAEQKFRLTEAMVDSSASDFESYEKIQGQQSVVDEEIASVNQQIALLEKMERSLTIRSDRDGFVDAWQINRRLSGRPVRRGDPLMQVISHDSPWLVDAQVSQSRIGRVRRADQASELSVMVTFDDDPAATHTASQWQFGPTRPSATASVGDQVKSAVTLTLDTPPEIDSSTNADSASTRSGAPARVYFHCGSVPLADLLVGDLYRDLRGQLALHWRLSDMKESEAF